jgi:dephospho-CoA kinase
MITVGLTGGIGSGKSTVSGFLRERGAPVIDADAIVHQLQAPGSPVLAEIAAAFGREVLRPDGSLDRPKLGAIVFADPARRHQLEAIVHPPVRRRIWELVDRYRAEGAPAVILDIPLLIEGGWQESLDQVWLVWVDAETQLRRLIHRDHLSEEAARARIEAQMPLDEKRRYADLIIDNTGSLAQTEAQVERAWRTLLGG